MYVKRALFRWRSARSNTKEEKNECATTGRVHSYHSFQDTNRHQHEYLERMIFPAKFIEGSAAVTVTTDERQTELVIDNSFPAGLETPEELLQ